MAHKDKYTATFLYRKAQYCKDVLFECVCIIKMKSMFNWFGLLEFSKEYICVNLYSLKKNLHDSPMRHYHINFISEETEDQKSEVNCPRLHNYYVEEVGFEPRFLLTPPLCAFHALAIQSVA